MQLVKILQLITKSKIVAVIRAGSSDMAIEYSEACIKGGITSVELTYTTPQVEKAITYLSEHHPHILTGAGTVLDAITAKIAIDAGAKFIVSPSFDKDTASLCNLYQIPYIPGCMTVTEMTTALSAGCSLIKLFPGGIYGPSSIKQFKAPLPQVSIMPSGGVDLENIEDWFSNGTEVVSVGGSLLKGSLNDIEDRAKKFINIVSNR
ncbi:bifunctional 2-keto-4-hydroxyglutarate aldolase/2-keto-3-deoxy-6-phosphogluconate aldolase [Sporosarcina highlanderae]|uniref:Bifunctional 2-keto-4-hydroxyglutarate aldolase/2-keto-3-deoxy-6-phosphogluconate aldolase n=1 Tax=Sporosarcina highlanderae TaxID=3035916 RepID=A0ABT8JL69_9BACL|nr:bifunctional 2-keto-4-hydroxyglutarate aldolase/2-keto-3-deoxy-6-phosphogluconate aldolase [Sporosarcina highlanderae]MDN4605890.1 bifunctional 2-keto-4-hydroxyglutarate aldolase/2-keto-3-deoxy-6-phosphogluconate aldolase [Sporosarcina highlanderae]